MHKLLLWGAGRHARVVLEVAQATGFFREFAFVDDEAAGRGPEFAGQAILGDSGKLAELAAGGFTHLTVCIGDNRARARCYRYGRRTALLPAILVHRSAVISPSAEIGAGTVIMPRVVVNAGATIGDNCIVNTGAIVEHDCRVGDHVHLAPGSILGGFATVGAFCFIGTGGIVLPEVAVGEGATIGAGAVAIREVAAGATAVGVPARSRERGERSR